MTIPPELEADIVRYYTVEKWRVGTIARQLHVHYTNVERVLRQAGVPLIDSSRSSLIDPLLPFIRQTLKKFPSITASQLHLMVKERGYIGSSSYFRYLIKYYRLRPAIENNLPLLSAEANSPLTTMLGEQAQVAWANFDHINIGSARHPLKAFVIVLQWSHRIFLRFFHEASTENFLRGHVDAFEAWGGLPKVMLYDNVKNDALERQGNAIHIHPVLLEFSSHYRFEPRLSKGKERSRVENTVRYIRESFFASRSFIDIADINRQAEAWCLEQADDRPCHHDKTLTVREAFTKEKHWLLELPSNSYSLNER